jgi:hypothetical protein
MLLSEQVLCVCACMSGVGKIVKLNTEVGGRERVWEEKTGHHGTCLQASCITATQRQSCGNIVEVEELWLDNSAKCNLWWFIFMGIQGQHFYSCRVKVQRSYHTKLNPNYTGDMMTTF